MVFKLYLLSFDLFFLVKWMITCSGLGLPAISPELASYAQMFLKRFEIVFLGDVAYEDGFEATLS